MVAWCPLAREILGDNLVEFQNNVRTAHAGNADTQYWQSHVQNEHMREFMAASYNSDRGFAIEQNPVTGLNEMFVAGTHSPTTLRGVKEWFQNVGEGVEHLVAADRIGYDVFGEHRKHFAQKLEQEARANNVHVVYGHSRGAAIISDFEESDGYVFIGLDGATGITENHGNILNIIHKGDLFDNAIAAHDKTSKNIHVPGTFHNVTTSSRRSRSKPKVAKRSTKTKHKKTTQKRKKPKKKNNNIVSPPPIVRQSRKRYHGSRGGERPLFLSRSRNSKKKQSRIHSPPRIQRKRGRVPSYYTDRKKRARSREEPVSSARRYGIFNS